MAAAGADVDMDGLPPSTPVFEIEVKANFIIMERDPYFASEMFEETGRFISHVLYQFYLEPLINNAYAVLLDMFNSMRVPVQPPEVEEVAAIAARLATAARDNGKVSGRMKVVVDAVVGELPDFGNHDDDTDDGDDGDGDDDGEGPLAAEEIAENVQKVVVDVSGQQCPICLEEFVAGPDSEAAFIPCSHVFHEVCIGTWLSKNNRCPVCRFKLSS